MGWLKREFIDQALEEIGLASYVFDTQPEQRKNALRKLDAMMATWNAKGIRLGYPIPTTPGDSDPDTDSDVPDRANEAIYLNLAIRLASAVGRPVSPELRISAKMAYDALLSHAAQPPEMQMPSDVPAGAGNRNTDRIFLDEPTETLDVGDDSELDL